MKALNNNPESAVIANNIKTVAQIHNEPERLIKFWLSLDKRMGYSTKLNMIYTSIFA